MTPELTPELQAAQAAARAAGERIMTLYRGEYSVSSKADSSPVTAADRAAQQVIADQLKPFGYGWVGEEDQARETIREADRFWVVDPLDGTKDFIHQTGDFAVMIGLVEAGQVIIGVVYLPARDVIYFAQKGAGAFRADGEGELRELHCSDINSLAEARMPVSRFHHGEELERLQTAAGVGRTVVSGSAGLKLALVAEGAAELYFIPPGRSRIWDIAAADIILRQAGGRLTDTTGERITYQPERTDNAAGVVAANAALFPAVLRAVQSIG